MDEKHAPFYILPCCLLCLSLNLIFAAHDMDPLQKLEPVRKLSDAKNQTWTMFFSLPVLQEVPCVAHRPE